METSHLPRDTWFNTSYLLQVRFDLCRCVHCMRQVSTGATAVCFEEIECNSGDDDFWGVLRETKVQEGVEKEEEELNDGGDECGNLL
mmetsp:Transcript_22049/g.39671  ORF Transcript_22049/g.39671 Transcript_22049/m.39671 type:complete len:87 (+) Transcript_22049:1288-1548(+)